MGWGRRDGLHVCQDLLGLPSSTVEPRHLRRQLEAYKAVFVLQLPEPQFTQGMQSQSQEGAVARPGIACMSRASRGIWCSSCRIPAPGQQEHSCCPPCRTGASSRLSPHACDSCQCHVLRPHWQGRDMGSGQETWVPQGPALLVLYLWVSPLLPVKWPLQSPP